MDKAVAMAKNLEALRVAPVTEPFNGPAILSGRASAVFFHEVLGHRLEGQRQRGDEEGQTFTKLLGKPILPVVPQRRRRSDPRHIPGHMAQRPLRL